MLLVWHKHYKQFIPTFDLTTVEGIREAVACEDPWWRNSEAWGSTGHAIAVTLLARVDALERDACQNHG